ncbi:putative xyloglucan galactosyltransferase gt17 [Ranunculus cassubicifolius]
MIQVFSRLKTCVLPRLSLSLHFLITEFNMLLRKLRSVALMADRGRNIDKDKEKHFPSSAVNHHYVKYSLLFVTFWFLFFFIFVFSSSSSAATSNKKKICHGNMSVYVYELPPKFNLGLLSDCKHLNVYTDMCPHVANRGLGQPITMDVDSSPSISSSWYATHQFIAEMIFHARVENHPCRTWEPKEDTVFYVPFYGGLHASGKFREADLVERDRLAVEMAKYVSHQPWWRRKQGKDHFLALGRTAWDFMRAEDGVDFGANALLNLPEVKNMSVLTVERHPWQGHNQYGIPYPSYLHPTTPAELMAWQEKMRCAERPHLFSFVGAPRTGVQKAAIRDEILRQCGASSECLLLKCGAGASKCHSPSEVLRVMTQSRFCLQAPGDSFTRRSTFDSILAGCIPVFFSPHTAYTQYGWYLPKDTTEYSVYIPEDQGKIIEEELRKIPEEKVERMRSTVIGMIPSLTYMHPNATTHLDFKDAVDVALERLYNNLNGFNSSSLLLPTL